MQAGAKALTKGAIRTTLAEQNELKPKQCAGIMDSLAALATAEVKKAGKFVIPSLCMIKTRHKPATKAGTRMAFGKGVKVKAKAARTIVKAYPVAALKQHFKCALRRCRALHSPCDCIPRHPRGLFAVGIL